MKKNLGVLVLMILLLGLMIGCSNQKSDVNESNHSNEQKNNPFEENNSQSNVTSIGHEFSNPQLDKNGERLPISYSGGEIKIDYDVNASGNVKNVGFLIFIDGIPQPYKFNTTEEPYEYMHIFELSEDDKDVPFTFVFTPVTGKQGDTLQVSITSVYNPAFMPDMKETVSYAGYHTTLDCYSSMFFNQDADALDTSDIPQYEYLNQVSLTSEPITPTFLELFDNLMGAVDMEELNTRVLTKVFIDDVDMNLISNILVKKSGTLHVTYKILGHPGVRFKNTFYINHKALTSKDEISVETVLTKGNVSVIDVDIKLDKLENFNTFYVISVPCNAADFPDDVVIIEKTASILLYK
jgi:hypothetical protein